MCDSVLKMDGVIEIVNSKGFRKKLYEFSRNYDMCSYDEYECSLLAKKLLSFSNKDSIIKYIEEEAIEEFTNLVNKI